MCGEGPPKRATARLQYRRRAEIGGSDGPTYKYKGAFTVKSTPIRIKYQGTAMPIASSSRPPPMPQLSQPRQPSPGMGSKGPKNPDLGPFSIKAIARAVVKSELKSHSDPHLYRFYDCIHIVPDSGREAPFIQFNQLVLCTLSLYRMCPRIRRVGRGTHSGIHITPGLASACQLNVLSLTVYRISTVCFSWRSPPRVLQY